LKIMPVYYEEIDGKRNFYIPLYSDSNIKLLEEHALSSGGLIERNTGKRLNIQTQMFLGKASFASIDRRYHPNCGLPLEELERIDFVLRDDALEELRDKGSVSSELPTGTVRIKVKRMS
jgi:hypothetical protein